MASLALLGLGLAVLPAACSSDDERPARLSNGGAGGTGGTAGTGGSGECVATSDFVQSCIDNGTSGCDEVTVCACNSCACLLADCAADEGCTAIRACATEKRCTGTTCALPDFC